jgi:hypothetical protein
MALRYLLAPYLGRCPRLSYVGPSDLIQIVSLPPVLWNSSPYSAVRRGKKGGIVGEIGTERPNHAEETQERRSPDRPCPQDANRFLFASIGVHSRRIKQSRPKFRNALTNTHRDSNAHLRPATKAKPCRPTAGSLRGGRFARRAVCSAGVVLGGRCARQEPRTPGRHTGG